MSNREVSARGWRQPAEAGVGDDSPEVRPEEVVMLPEEDFELEIIKNDKIDNFGARISAFKNDNLRRIMGKGLERLSLDQARQEIFARVLEAAEEADLYNLDTNENEIIVARLKAILERMLNQVSQTERVDDNIIAFKKELVRLFDEKLERQSRQDVKILEAEEQAIFLKKRAHLVSDLEAERQQLVDMTLVENVRYILPGMAEVDERIRRLKLRKITNEEEMEESREEADYLSARIASLRMAERQKQAKANDEQVLTSSEQVRALADSHFASHKAKETQKRGPSGGDRGGPGDGDEPPEDGDKLEEQWFKQGEKMSRQAEIQIAGSKPGVIFGARLTTAEEREYMRALSEKLGQVGKTGKARKVLSAENFLDLYDTFLEAAVELNEVDIELKQVGWALFGEKKKKKIGLKAKKEKLESELKEKRAMLLDQINLVAGTDEKLQTPARFKASSRAAAVEGKQTSAMEAKSKSAATPLSVEEKDILKQARRAPAVEDAAETKQEVSELERGLRVAVLSYNEEILKALKQNDNIELEALLVQAIFSVINQVYGDNFSLNAQTTGQIQQLAREVSRVLLQTVRIEEKALQLGKLERLYYWNRSELYSSPEEIERDKAKYRRDKAIARAYHVDNAVHLLASRLKPLVPESATISTFVAPMVTTVAGEGLAVPEQQTATMKLSTVKPKKPFLKRLAMGALGLMALIGIKSDNSWEDRYETIKPPQPPIATKKQPPVEKETVIKPPKRWSFPSDDRIPSVEPTETEKKVQPTEREQATASYQVEVKKGDTFFGIIGALLKQHPEILTRFKTLHPNYKNPLGTFKIKAAMANGGVKECSLIRPGDKIQLNADGSVKLVRH